MPALLKTTQIQEPSSATVNLTLDTLGNASFAGMPYGASSFLRNRIINGGMQVAQYGTSVTPTVSNFTYAMDRFFCALNAGTSGFTVTQLSQANTALAGFYNALRYQRNSGQTSTTTMAVGQTIETANCYDLAGQNVTLSFYARAGSNFSATSSQITARIATGTGVDQGSAAAYNGTWTGYAQTNNTITLTTSWQRFTVTAAIGSSVNEIQILFYWAGTGTAGTNDYVDITGVQLEQGSVATPFERRLYGQEMALCQRYLPAFTATANGWRLPAVGLAQNSNTVWLTLTFPNTTRVPPTGMTISSASHWVVGVDGLIPPIAFSSFTFGTNASCNAARITGTSSTSPFSVGQVVQVDGNSTSANLYFTGCEL